MKKAILPVMAQKSSRNKDVANFGANRFEKNKTKHNFT